MSSRQNPAVLSQPAKVFAAIVQALEGDAIQGQTAQRAVASAKALVAASGLDAAGVLAGMSPETQKTARAWFA